MLSICTHLIDLSLIKLHQSQVQTLQIQSQALHTIQDQQGTIITALMPLLPLLQAIPLHIESARNTLKDTITSSLKTPVHTTTYLDHGQEISSTRSRGEKRSSSTLRSDGPPSPSPLPNKRPRIFEASKIADRPSQHMEEATSAVEETISQARKRSVAPDPQHEDPPQDPVQLASFLPLYTATTPSSLNRQSSITTTDLKTPRRPLGELFLQTQVPTEVSSLTRTATPRFINTNSRPHSRLASPSDSSCSPRLLAIMRSAQRPPRLLHVHTSIPKVTSTAHAPTEATSNQGFEVDTRGAIEKDQSPRLALRAAPGVELANQPPTSQLSLAPSSSSRPGTVIPTASPAPVAPTLTIVPRPFPLNTALPAAKQTRLAGPGIPPQPQPPIAAQGPRFSLSGMKLIPMSSMGIRERRSPFVSYILTF